ncbi:DNA primase family protein [Bibersteinia trehalosi]|uniref:DNA primase family protein n=1 Tax=Bibersteinia trehalosi TaxID=47735 RepID=UPI002D78A50D|nr:DUF5906 domain-containing protein [Bibersteinia trehalosi]
MSKLKNAPNMKKQPQDVYSVLLVAGSQAWDFAEVATLRNSSEIAIDKFLPADNAPPIILTSETLENVARYRIAPPKVQQVTLWTANNGQPLDGTTLTAICSNLATHTTAKTVQLVDETGQLLEDLSGYIDRLRTDDSTQETAQQILKKAEQNAPLEPLPLSDRPTQRELLSHFLAWQKEPLKQDLLFKRTHRYNGKFWQALEDEELDRLVLKFFEELDLDFTDNRISSLARLVTKKIDELPPQAADLIGFQNVVLNKQTGEVFPFAPELNLRGIENFELNQNSTDTPHFDDWLHFVTDDGNDSDKRAVIMASLYMTLKNRNEWQKFIEITGIGGSGKSIMVQMMTMLNGSHNVATIDINGLDEPKLISGLIGKTLAYSPDQGDYKGMADGLKRLTGNETLKAHIFYKNPFDVVLNACFAMSTNYPLLFTDRNGGVSRRRIIIELNRKIPVERKDPYFREKLQGELYGIIQKVLAEFPDENTARMVLEEHIDTDTGLSIKQQGNHLIDFASYFKVSNDTKGLRWGSNRTQEERPNEPKTIYKGYILYCECVGIKPLNLRTFKTAFKDALKDCGEKTEVQEIKSSYYFTNIHYKDKENALKEWIG